MEPMDLFKKGLIAPHRALAIACFPIGLPTALFARLGPVRHGIRSMWRDSNRASTTTDVEAAMLEVEDAQASNDDEAARTRSWEIHFAVLSTTNRWIHMGIKGVADLAIFGLSGLMVYKNWVVNLLVMVPWKCETPIMTFAWYVLLVRHQTPPGVSDTDLGHD